MLDIVTNIISFLLVVAIVFIAYRLYVECMTQTSVAETVETVDEVVSDEGVGSLAKTILANELFAKLKLNVIGNIIGSTTMSVVSPVLNLIKTIVTGLCKKKQH